MTDRGMLQNHENRFQSKTGIFTEQRKNQGAFSHMFYFIDHL